MYEYYQAFTLAWLQGLTEFLPISSSGHLVVLPSLLGWPDQRLAFDVAVHVGTLIAVLVYFHREVEKMQTDWVGTLVGRASTVHSRVARLILFATAVTTVLAGFAIALFGDIISGALRQPVPVAIATIVFGIVLGVADWVGPKMRDVEVSGRKIGVILGCAQALALIPGASRAGVTISAGLFIGLARKDAARISFLMSIPIIVLSGGWQARNLFQSSDPVRWDILIFATVISAVVALGCIHWMLDFVQRHSMLVFVVYRIVLGVILLLVFM